MALSKPRLHQTNPFYNSKEPNLASHLPVEQHRTQKKKEAGSSANEQIDLGAYCQLDLIKKH